MSLLVGLPSLFDQVCCDDPVDNTGYPTRDLRMAGNSFVLRTDVKSYYASIDHVRLLEQLAEFIKERGRAAVVVAVPAPHGGLGWPLPGTYTENLTRLPVEFLCSTVGLRMEAGVQ